MGYQITRGDPAADSLGGNPQHFGRLDDRQQNGEGMFRLLTPITGHGVLLYRRVNTQGRGCRQTKQVALMTERRQDIAAQPAGREVGQARSEPDRASLLWVYRCDAFATCVDSFIEGQHVANAIVTGD